MISSIRRDDEIIVWKLDKSLNDRIGLFKMFEEKGANFKSIEDAIDTTTSLVRKAF